MDTMTELQHITENKTLPKAPDAKPQCDGIDFFNIEQGLACWKSCQWTEGSLYVAYAKIRILLKREDFLAVDRLKEFIRVLFRADQVHLTPENFRETGTACPITFTVYKKNISLGQDAEKWLANCTMLNTYREYFLATTGIFKLRILCGINSYRDEAEMAAAIPEEIIVGQDFSFTENLAINDIVYANTSAGKELAADPIKPSQDFPAQRSRHRWYGYDLVFSQLAEELAGNT